MVCPFLGFEEGKMMEAQAIAYTTNYASVVFKLLIECLEANGALHPGQFQKVLRATIAHPKAERQRLDYVLLSELLKQLEAAPERGQ
jgi:hypothetical protein